MPDEPQDTYGLSDEDPVPLPDDDLARCPSCHEVLPIHAILCMNCGLDLRIGRTMRTLVSNADDHKPGIYNSWQSIVYWSLVIGLVVGAWTWWSTGPARDYQLHDAQLVDRHVALHSIGRLEPIALRLDLANSGRTMVRGPLPGMTSYNTHNTVGGGGKLLALRPADAGKYIVVRGALSQRFMDRHKLRHRYDVVFSADKFELHGGADGPVKAILMRKSVEGPFTLNLADAPTVNYTVLMPPGFEPANEQVKDETTPNARGDNTWTDLGDLAGGDTTPPTTGHVEYDGAGGLSGRFDFQTFGSVGMMRARGINAKGTLELTDPAGINVKYEYTGANLLVTVNEDTTLYRATKRYRQKKDFWTYKKWDLILLFERPAKLVSVPVVKCGGVELVKLDDDLFKMDD